MALDDAGLDLGDARGRVNRDDAIHVLREVEHECRVASLASEAGASAARQNRHRVFACDRKRRDYVTLVPRNDHADRHLAIVRRVGGVGRASARVEAHFAFDLACEFELQGVERSHRGGAIVVERWRRGIASISTRKLVFGVSRKRYCDRSICPERNNIRYMLWSDDECTTIGRFVPSYLFFIERMRQEEIMQGRDIVKSATMISYHVSG